MSDYETIQKRRNIIVGIFVIVAVCALVWLIFKFGDLPSGVTKLRSFQVYVRFRAAPGVQRDTPVRFCGYQIGRVTDVMSPQILPEVHDGNETELKYHQTVVVLSIDRSYVNIPFNSEVKLMTRGLGSSYIEIRAPLPDPNNPVTKFLNRGSLLQGSTGMTSEFFPEESQKKLDELITSLNVLINNTNDIVGDPNNKENLKKSLANLAEASGRARDAIETFQKFAAAGTSTLKNVDENLVTAMVDTSEELSRATSQLRLILEKINSGQGSAGMLLNDGRFYENLLENTQQLQALLEEVRGLIAKSKGIPIKFK